MLGPSLFGPGGVQLGALMESMGQLGEAGMDTNGCQSHTVMSAGKGKGPSGAPRGQRTLRRSGQASEEVTAQWPGG